MKKGVTVIFRNCLVALAMAASLGSAHAQNSVMVIPAGAGGHGDIMARHYAERLRARLGENIIVDNKPGASGALAASTVVRAPADGRTILMATGGSAITVMPFLKERMPYDPVKDLTPVAMVADLSMGVAVRHDSPYKTIQQLLEDARQRPGQVALANTGVGTISHLLGEMLGQATKVSFLHVPFQNIGGALTEVYGVRVDALTSTSAGLEDQIKGGKLRMLATFSKDQLPSAAGAPTMAQALNVDTLAVPLWFGIFLPAKTPQATVDKISSAFVEVCKSPETLKKFGEVVACASPPEFAKILEQDRERWRTTIQQANIKLQ